MYKLDDIGNRIRDIRNKNGWLIHQLSERTGLSVAHISSIERGKCNFSIESLIKISEALNTTVNYLLFGKEHSSEVIAHELNQIVDDCDYSELCILIDNAKSLKKILRKNVK